MHSISRVIIIMISTGLSLVLALPLAGETTLSTELEQLLAQKKISGDRRAAEEANKKGLTLHNAKKFREAEREYINAAGLDPSFGTPYFNIACVRALTGHGETSLRFLRKALELDPSLLGPAKNDSDLASVRGLQGYHDIVSPGRQKNPDFQGILGKTYALKGCDSPDGVRQGKFRLDCVVFTKLTFRDNGVLAVESGGGGACSYARSTRPGSWSVDKNFLEIAFSYQMVQGCDSGGAAVGSVLKTLPVSLRYNTLEEFLADFEAEN